MKKAIILKLWGKQMDVVIFRLNIEIFFSDYSGNGSSHIFSASLWKCHLKIPRDARINAFAGLAIKSNENRWMTQDAVRSWYVYSILIRGAYKRDLRRNWEELVQRLLRTVEHHNITIFSLRYQKYTILRLISAIRRNVFLCHVLSSYLPGFFYIKCLNQLNSILI